MSDFAKGELENGIDTILAILAKTDHMRPKLKLMSSSDKRRFLSFCVNQTAHLETEPEYIRARDALANCGSDAGLIEEAGRHWERDTDSIAGRAMIAVFGNVPTRVIMEHLTGILLVAPEAYEEINLYLNELHHGIDKAFEKEMLDD